MTDVDCIPAFGFSHQLATMTTFEYGNSDRRATKTTPGDESSDRITTMSIPEKERGYRRSWIRTLLIMMSQSTSVEDFSESPAL